MLRVCPYTLDMVSKTQQNKAIKWARVELTRLLAKKFKGEPLWPVKSAENQVLSDVARKFNLGCEAAVAKALKITRHDETEEETQAWENGTEE